MSKIEIERMMSRDSNTSAEFVATACLASAIVLIVLAIIFN